MFDFLLHVIVWGLVLLFVVWLIGVIIGPVSGTRLDWMEAEGTAALSTTAATWAID